MTQPPGRDEVIVWPYVSVETTGPAEQTAWRAVADRLAAAMQHSERGICTLTQAEHDALAEYQRALAEKLR